MEKFSLSKINKHIYIDLLIKCLGYIVILGVAVIPVIFFYYSLPLLKINSIFEILFSDWNPENRIYGLGIFILTSLIISIISTVISFVISMSISLFIYENKNKKMGMVLKKIIEFSSGIPTVVYGFIGVILLVPIIRNYTKSPTGFSLLATIIMLSVLIMPTMVLYINQSFNSLPDSIKNACLSLGATTPQFYFYTLIPQSFRGIVIAIILGFSRSISDTMLALMISGNAFRFPNSIFESSRALTAHIALVLPGEFDGMEFKAIFFTSLLLIGMIFLLNLVIKFVERKR